MRSYEERAKDFIKEIFPYIAKNMQSPWYVREGVNKFNKKRSRNVKMRAGCARIALLTSDYVVKFDYDYEEVESIGGCANEAYMYDIAEREGFAYLFAKTTHVTYQNHDFYIMPLIEGVDDCNGSAWHHMTITEANWCHDHSVTDLHSGNYGFRDGHVCIFDYGYVNSMVEDPRSYGSFDSNSPSTSIDHWWENLSKVSFS
jgi:hypothetical protein